MIVYYILLTLKLNITKSQYNDSKKWGKNTVSEIFYIKYTITVKPPQKITLIQMLTQLGLNKLNKIFVYNYI